jgi:hypothetical protein
MITNLINLLMRDNYYGVSERVDIVKGKYELPYTWNKGIDNIKRRWYGRRGKSSN